MYLLDTDWVIQALAGRQPAARELRLLAGARVYFSLITAGEIYERAFVHANPTPHLIGFRQFLSAYRMLPLTDAIMEQFAELRATLRRHGQLITDFDLLIAATALNHDLALLTFNRRDYQRIPDLKLYQPT